MVFSAVSSNNLAIFMLISRIALADLHLALIGNTLFAKEMSPHARYRVPSWIVPRPSSLKHDGEFLTCFNCSAFLRKAITYGHAAPSITQSMLSGHGLHPRVIHLPRERNR
jgi:hypothetical protein